MVGLCCRRGLKLHRTRAFEVMRTTLKSLILFMVLLFLHCLLQRSVLKYGLGKGRGRENMFSENLKKFRQQKGLTQEELA